MPDYGITYDASAYLVNYGSFTSGVRGIVIHSLECDAVPHIAEQLSARGGWLDNEGLAPQRMTDPVSIVRCVPDLDSAGHIGGPGNQHYVGVEVSGRAAWVRSQWLDGGNAQAALQHQARAVAGLYLLLGHTYDEIRWLSLAQLRTGSPFGMCTHNDITLSGVSQTTHWDPGLGYPFAWFQSQVQAWFLLMSGAKPEPPAPVPAPPVLDRNLLEFIMSLPGAPANLTYDKLINDIANLVLISIPLTEHERAIIGNNIGHALNADGSKH